MDPLTPGETFLKGQWEDFLSVRRYFIKRETYQFRDYLSSSGFFMGKTFYVTPAHLACPCVSPPDLSLSVCALLILRPPEPAGGVRQVKR